MVVMPGGFGTLDEFMEVVTLVQTLKIKKRLPIVLFGVDYWDSILNLEPMVEYGTISPADLDLFFKTDSVEDACEYLVKELTSHVLALEEQGPADSAEYDSVFRVWKRVLGVPRSSTDRRSTPWPSQETLVGRR